MKQSLTKTLAIGLTVLSLAATSAFAAEVGGVKIHGNVDQTATVQNATVSATGNRATAAQSIAGIHGYTDITGNVKQVVSVGNATVTASGDRSTACQAIGTIGDNPACHGYHYQKGLK
jgi:hypothetical protein